MQNELVCEDFYMHVQKNNKYYTNLEENNDEAEDYNSESLEDFLKRLKLDDVTKPHPYFEQVMRDLIYGED